MSAASVLQVTAVVLAGCVVVACTRTETASPTTGDHAEVAPVEQGVPMERLEDLDPAVMRRALETTLGVTVEPLGTARIPVPTAPFRDVVAFKVSGLDYCRANHPDDDCESSEGLTWSMQEILGIAVVGFENREAPFVITHRYFGCSPSKRPTSRERPRMPFAAAPALMQTTDVQLDELTVEDLDGDGHDEYALKVAHVQLTSVSEGDEPGAAKIFFHRHLLVLRDDLTLEADGIVHQEWDRAAPGWSLDHDYVEEHVMFDKSKAGSPATITVEWCEVDPYLDGCAADLCPSPTERIVAEYEQAADGYVSAKATPMRAPASDCE